MLSFSEMAFFISSPYESASREFAAKNKRSRTEVQQN